MGTYGRFFDFLRSPDPKHRLGRFKTGSSTIVQGAPVTGGADPDSWDDRWTVALATQATGPTVGKSGILVWEAPFTGLNGHDPVLDRASDIDTVPAATPAQVVHGDECAVVLHNLDDESYVNRAYEGRNMVKLADAKTLSADDLLTPGAGNGDAGGYWEVTATASEGWLRVIKANFDATTGFGYCEAVFLF